MDCQGVSDLNGAVEFRHPSGFGSAGGRDEHRQDPVRPDHGLPAVEDLSPDRGALPGRSSGADAFLRRAVPLHGLCPAHLSGESARHRSVPVGPGGKALPHGISTADQPLDVGRCQRSARLAHLCRLRPGADHAGKEALRHRRLRGGAVEHGLCAGRHHHRPVSVGVPVGAVSLHQGSGEAAHAARSARAPSRRSSTSRMGSSTTSMCSICSSPSPAPST